MAQIPRSLQLNLITCLVASVLTDIKFYISTYYHITVNVVNFYSFFVNNSLPFHIIRVYH